MIDPRHLTDLLLDNQAVADAARRAGGRLVTLHAFASAPAARSYPLEHRRLAWRAAVALTEFLEVAEKARAREEARP